MDKISIITVSYNCVDEIEMSIKSVLEQDYPNIEYIIIDGASTDGTVDVIKKYENMISYWISEPDKGLYYAMNKGICISTGEWIYFLNAGDKLETNNTISRIFADKNYDNIHVLYGSVLSKRNNGIIKIEPEHPFFDKGHRFLSMGLSHQGVFVRGWLCKKYLFDTKYRCCADFDMLFRIHAAGYTFFRINVIIAEIEGRGGFSNDNRKIQRFEEAKIYGVEKTIKFRMYNLYLDFKGSIKNICRL